MDDLYDGGICPSCKRGFLRSTNGRHVVGDPGMYEKLLRCPRCDAIFRSMELTDGIWYDRETGFEKPVRIDWVSKDGGWAVSEEFATDSRQREGGIVASVGIIDPEGNHFNMRILSDGTIPNPYCGHEPLDDSEMDWFDDDSVIRHCTTVLRRYYREVTGKSAPTRSASAKVRSKAPSKKVSAKRPPSKRSPFRRK